MKKSGIYAITNKLNGKPYIGSAVDMHRRFGEHKKMLRKGWHHSVKLQHAWNKYGEDSFVFAPLIVCDPRDLIFFEQRFIDRFGSASNGYNVSPTAGNTLGTKFSKETKMKISEAMKGKRTRLGAILSEETKQKLSKSNTGKIISLDVRMKIGASLLGKVTPAETRAKMSISAKNLSPVIKAKRAAARVYTKLSDETNAKISASKKASIKVAVENCKSAVASEQTDMFASAE
jgi:group I intron endonuclease